MKVLLSIGGASASTSSFESVAGNSEKLNTMAQSAITLFETYNFDGLDIDWEYPYDKSSFTALLSGLWQILHPKGYLLTVAVNSIPGEVGGYDIPAMNK